MRAASSAPACAPPRSMAIPRGSAAALRLADYLELSKPRIALLALVTVAVGYTLASAGQWRSVRLLDALFGIALVAAASSAFNQLIERRIDARMDRTANRPLPAGRLSVGEVFLFGLTAGAMGVVYLALCVNQLTAFLAVLALVLYAFVYTPLKRMTSLCTVIGAVSGALPPVLGWTASGASLDERAFALFAILFLWQFPHFLAIAWLYREDYSRAGLRMLPASVPSPRVTGLMAVVYTLALLPVSLLPSELGLAGTNYFLAAMLLGAGYLLSAVRFLARESTPTARGLLWSSLVYLPAVLLTLTWDHIRLLQ